MAVFKWEVQSKVFCSLWRRLILISAEICKRTHRRADRQQLVCVCAHIQGRSISQLKTTYEQQKGARHVSPSLLSPPCPSPLPRLSVREDPGRKCVWRSHQPNYQGGRKHNTSATAAKALQTSSTATHCRPLRSKCVHVCVSVCACQDAFCLLRQSVGVNIHVWLRLCIQI